MGRNGKATSVVYAVVRSAWAWAATASAAWIVPPVTTPGGKPLTAEPGLTPRLPVTRVGPVLVTVVPPRTAKLAAEPRRLASKTRSSHGSSDRADRTYRRRVPRVDAGLGVRHIRQRGKDIGEVSRES